MKRTNKIITVAIIALVCLLFFRFIDPIPLQLLRGSLFDFYQRLEPREVEKLPVTIVDIDEKSLSEIGQWPWPRTILAELLEKISTLQPLAIGFDMMFPEPDRLSPSNVVSLLPEESRNLLANKLNLANSDENLSNTFSTLPIVLGSMVNYLTHGTNPETTVKPVFNWNNSPIEFLPTILNRTANLESFEAAASGVGVFTLLPEADGVVRGVPTLYQVRDQVWPAFGLEVLRVALGAKNINVSVDKAGIDSVTTGGITVPTNAKGLTLVHFNQHQTTRFVSAVDFLKDRIGPGLYEGHIFLIGTSAGGLHDVKMTPMTEQMPGVEIWAQWLESSLFGKLLERPNYAFVAEMIFLLFSGILLILLTVKASARFSFIVYLLLTVICIGFSWWMYTNKSQLFDASFPVLSTGVLFSILMLMKFWHEEQQRKQIKSAFSHYLSPSIVNELAASPEQLKLGGESKEITSLFTDLQGFTSLSETFEPEKLVALINEYLDGICKLAIEHNGTIDKIIGDAVHIFFGAPKDLKNHADHAVDCALKIDEFCRYFRQRKLEQGFEVGETRIGVNSGRAVVGNFGGQERFDYTAYGDTINTASRLETVNQYLGSTICVSNSTTKLCQKHQFRPLADITVKGRVESLMVYEPVSQNTEIKSYLKLYCEIFSKIKIHDSNALEQLQELYSQYPNDLVLKFFLDSINHSNIISVKRDFSEK